MLQKLMTYHPTEVSYTTKLRNAVELHRSWLMSRPSTKQITVTESSIIPFKHNLFLYLSSMDIPVELHWPILLLSGLEDPTDFTEQTKVLYQPSVGDIENILSTSR